MKHTVKIIFICSLYITTTNAVGSGKEEEDNKYFEDTEYAESFSDSSSSSEKPEPKNDNDLDMLMDAILRCDFETFKTQIELLTLEQLNAYIPSLGYNLLHWTIFMEQQKVPENFYAIILFLIKKGIDINAKTADEDEETSLHLAIKNAHFDLIDLLLEYGEDPNIANKKGDTALHEVVKNLKIIKGELKYGKNTKIIELLLEHGANPHLVNHEGDTPLHIIASSLEATENEPEMIALLSDNYTIRLENNVGLTAEKLSVNIRNRSLQVKKCQPHRNKKITKTKENKNITSLCLSREITSKPFTSFLIPLNDFEDRISDFENAIFDGDIAELKRLIAMLRPGELSALTTTGHEFSTGYNLLHLIATLDKDHFRSDFEFFEKNHLKMAQALIDNGIKINAQTDHPEKNTALNLAARQNNVPLVKLLLENAADPGISNYSDSAESDDEEFTASDTTPLHEAAKNGNIALVKLLVKYGANSQTVNKKEGNTPLHTWLLNMPIINEEAITLLSDDFIFTLENNEGQTPENIIQGIREGKYELETHFSDEDESD